MSKIRTRIAPSPTGNLHVGTARAALFNELYARKQGGEFVVRIEDTDKTRSLRKYEKTIMEGLKWLGLSWDEGPDIGGETGPYRQSERGNIYGQAIQKLLDSGQAFNEEGSDVIKLKVKAQEVEFEDLVRGKVTVHSDTWGGDFVIARALNDPVFHLAVVVDDDAMRISHVIRGEDHLTNTARHILIQRALGYDSPRYGHLPLLLDERRRKLSKRTGETSLLAYRDEGFLPEAMMNYLALLGWNPGDNQEIFSHEELIKVFTLEKVQKGGAIFSRTKLVSVNKEYMKTMNPTELWQRARPFFGTEAVKLDDEYMAKAIATEQTRVGTLSEMPEALAMFAPDWMADYDPSLLVWRKSDARQTQEHLSRLVEQLEKTAGEDYTEEELDKNIITWIDDNGWGKGDVLWPLRVALTGRENSPGPFEVASVLGKKESLRRIGLALDFFNS